MRVRPTIATLAVGLCALAAAAAPASADWTTYHGDALRTGVDSADPATRALSDAWSATLAGNTHASPLVFDHLVFVATESDDVYAFDEQTGAQVWHQSAGTPMPKSALPTSGGLNGQSCANLNGTTIGITSTPVIDPATGKLFVVANVWDGTHAHHVLIRYDALTGHPDFSEPVDPPNPPSGYSAANQLQRASLNLAGGRVVIGMGGDNGDCDPFWGWLITAPENDADTLAHWQDSLGVWRAPSTEGAIWAPGGPAVDSAGHIYATTGNADTNAGDPGGAFDYGNSLIRWASSDPGDISPTDPADYFTAPTWASDNASDLDMGSVTPAVLPNGLIFQGGKNGNGYLVSSSDLASGVHTAVAQGPVCRSFGADAYAGDVLYVPCNGWGSSPSKSLEALSVAGGASPCFAPLASWRAPSDANGPPIVAGGLVWVTAWGGSMSGKLYGLDPLTGAIVVNQSTPAMEHFATPAASDGMLFLDTGASVQAYNMTSSGTGSAPPPSAPPPLCPVAITSGGSALATPAPPTPAPVTVTPSRSKTPPRCAHRLVIRLPNARHGIVRAWLYLGHRRLARARGRHLTTVRIAAPRGRSFTLRLVETTSHGRRVVRLLRWRNCRRVAVHAG